MGAIVNAGMKTTLASLVLGRSGPDSSLFRKSGVDNRGNEGMSLVEILVWLAIVTILTVGTSYAIARMLQKARVTAAADIISTAMAEARNNALASRGGGNWQVTIDPVNTEVSVSCLNCTISQPVQTYDFHDSVLVSNLPPNNLFAFDGQLTYTDSGMTSVLSANQVISVSAGAAATTIDLPPLGPPSVDTVK